MGLYLTEISPKLTGVASTLNYIGNRTVTQINSLSPSAADSVVATSAGTPTSAGSDALAIGDITEYNGFNWQKIVTNVGGFVPAGIELIVSSGVLYSPLTDGTDEGYIAIFGGTSNTPTLVSGVEGFIYSTKGNGSVIENQLWTWDEDSATWDRIAGQNLDTIRFTKTGTLSTETGTEGAWIAPRACTLSRITLYRRTAGSSGSTTADVNINGTTVFTTQANRPSVTAAVGGNATSIKTNMEVVLLTQNDRLEVDIDAVEGGTPADMTVIIEVTYP